MDTHMEGVMKKKKPIDMSKVKPEDMMKYEIAKELGLFDKVLSQGWGTLSAQETGRIGGLMQNRKRKPENAVGQTRKGATDGEKETVVYIQSQGGDGENKG